MKATLNWLKEFVEIELSPKELAQRLTHAGLEVESVETIGEVPSSVITVKIEKIEKHPQADRLTVCQVSSERGIHSIVCGAKNMKEGDKVALALPGTLLPDGKKIEGAVLRGVASEGMLCSEKELGLADEAEGIMILPLDTPLGKPLTEALQLADTIFEINVTPNRADCLSIMGIAREIAAITQKTFKPLKPKLAQGSFSLEGKLRVEVDPAARELCPRYTARMIQKIQIAPSPPWVVRRLKNVGIRAINNVVDATNYAMIETGQPLHAFDAGKISKNTIRIQCLGKKGVLKTLDEVERPLNSTDLLICDSEKILAIAGIMGGLDSGVCDTTKTLLLESAYFNPLSIRRSSSRLGLKTESSFRFERGVDPNAVSLASDRLAQLILEWAGGELSKEFIDTAQIDFPPQAIKLRATRTNALLGTSWDSPMIQSALERLQFHPKKSVGDSWECEIPTYRRDLKREIDLIEEVARINGYDQIPASLPTLSLRLAQDYYEKEDIATLRAYLVDEGFFETIHFSFISEKEIQETPLKVEGGHLLKLSNPLSDDLEVMRPSLIPSLLSCLKKNISHQNEELKLFELRTFFEHNQDKPPREQQALALAWAGHRYNKQWGLVRDEVDYYDLKGVIEGIWNRLLWPRFELRSSQKAYLHPGMSAQIIVEGNSIGDFGFIHPKTAQAFDLKTPVLLAEISFNPLENLPRKLVSFQPLPRYPSVERDLTLVVSEDLEGQRVIQEIEALKIPTLRQVELFDVYRGKPIEEGKKALTYSVVYQAPDRTLTDAEVNQTHQIIVEQLKNTLPIEWR